MNKSMGRMAGSTSTVPPSTDGHHFRICGCKYSRKKLMLICAIVLLLMYVFRLYEWTSIWDQFKTHHKEITAEEVIFSLSWAPTTFNFTSFKNSSSALHSMVRLEQPRAQYCVGDTMNVLVEMRNHAGHPKSYGGDFILARIHSPKLKASTSGDVTDFLNGTYRVRFHLFWPGVVQVSVCLIHSSEAVAILRRDWMDGYSKIMHMGTFIRDKKRESAQCGLRLSATRPLCEYRKKNDGEYYTCHRPKTLPCDSLTIMKSYIPSPHFTKEEVQELARENTGIEIKNNFQPVTVSDCTGVPHRPTEKCVAGLNSPFPGGYFHSNKWSSSFCHTGPFLSSDAITRCLKGKTIYLMGDSTVFQWVEYLEKKLNGLRSIQEGDPTLLADAKNSINIWWIRQFVPWIGSAFVNITRLVPIAEVLDSIAVSGKQEDVTVIIGIGQHLRPYAPEVLIRRLLNIRRAILRLHARSPQANVIIKLENTRELKAAMVHMSDWYGYMHNQVHRMIFEGMKVALVDAWDMTVAANSFAIHPNEVVVSNQVAMALSFVCH